MTLEIMNFDQDHGVNIKRCDLEKCEALCCYDGVYLHDGEEALIVEILKKYPDHFNLPEEPIVNGDWMGKVKGRKTATVPYSFKRDKPKHFTDTRCVFVTSGHRCSLQVLGNETGVHPWTFKPSACWLFPLHLTGDRIIPPPKIDEEDPNDLGTIYPGFVKYTPCGMDCDDGENWSLVLKDEISYLSENAKNLVILRKGSNG